MQLTAYRQKHNLSIDDLAERLDMKRNSLISLLYGHRRPSLDVALAIEDATDGEVGPRDWPEKKGGE